MDDQQVDDRMTDEFHEAYAAARALLSRAEADAAAIRADADRYRRQREQEAELIVAKARRLLMLAEERSAARLPGTTVVVDLARADAAAEPVQDRGPAPAGPDESIRPSGSRTRNELDAILATAVFNAVSRALPSDR